MRCIEISKKDASTETINQININMRCIEIKIYEITHAPTKGLTLT